MFRKFLLIMWNELIKIRDNTKNEDTANTACILLLQMNTAGGIDIIKKEVKRFIFKNKNNYETKQK